LPVQKWLDDQHGGDKLVACTRLMTPTNYQVTPMGNHGKVGSTEPTRILLGLDPEKRSLALGWRPGLLTLTATHFYLLRLEPQVLGKQGKPWKLTSGSNAFSAELGEELQRY